MLEKIKKQITLKNIGIFLMFLIPFVVGWIFGIDPATFSLNFLLISLGFSFLVVFIFTGEIFFESLFKLGAYLSLLIFLAQAYCRSTGISQADENIKWFVYLGFFFISIKFIKKLYKQINKMFQTMTKDEALPERVFFILLLGISISSFVGLFVRILFPILDNLCY